MIHSVCTKRYNNLFHIRDVRKFYTQNIVSIAVFLKRGKSLTTSEHGTKRSLMQYNYETGIHTLIHRQNNEGSYDYF
jgi:hypothetical protein